MRNPDTPKSGVKNISWNSQFEKWHVRLHVYIDGMLTYASFGLYTDLDEAREMLDKARAGQAQPAVIARRMERAKQLVEAPRFTSKAGLPPPKLALVSTQHLLDELKRRGVSS